ncbi:MAG: hypothetical protein AB1414_01225 [bacterium]
MTNTKVVNYSTFRSKKFVITLLTLALLIANAFGAGISEEIMNDFIKVVIAYLASQGIVDITKQFKK